MTKTLLQRPGQSKRLLKGMTPPWPCSLLYRSGTSSRCYKASNYPYQEKADMTTSLLAELQSCAQGMSLVPSKPGVLLSVPPQGPSGSCLVRDTL